ncbi:nucleolar protein 12 [Wyeomyia smithii]|uniref:nucleolar protein 12 n=1 Tax=Wyeomyia smithii TaxID=174621 RepID=UPI002467FE1C|nr:nucleolar protein 12 [Wyeomyia smithii]
MKRKSQEGNKPAYVKRKVELVFDPEKRAEFLTGFHKRKQQRKKVAQTKVQRQLKEEARRIRNEAKNNVKKLYHSYKPIPELAEQDQEEQEYDTGNVTVKVVELSTTELAKENNWIGQNHSAAQQSETDVSEESFDENELEAIPGMSLTKEKVKKSKNHDETELEDTVENEPQPEKSCEKEKPKQSGPKLNLDGVSSKKELNKKLKRHALKSMQKSKAFQQSARAQQQKQLKKSRRVRHFKEKHLKRKGKLNDDRKGEKKHGRRK